MSSDFTGSQGADWDMSPLQSQEPLPAALPEPRLPARLGEYEIRGKLGGGSMGTVLRGYHPVLQAEVAIKILKAGAGVAGHQLERFRREAMAAARLRHPNVVGVHTVGVHGRLPYLVMDLVPGKTLSTALEQRGVLPQKTAASIALAIARALDHAHTRGVLHRDVKPSNIFLGPDDAPLLGDFGLAKVVDVSRAGLTGTHDLLGTPGYMAPEQTEAGNADERSDIYGLGATLFAMLTGGPPHRGDTLLQFLDRLHRQPARPVRDLRPDVHPDLDRITLGCLAPDPARRYASAKDLAADLQRYLAGEPLRPPSPWVSRLVVALCGVFLVAAGALLARALTVSPSPSPAASTSPPGPIDALLESAGRALEAGDPGGALQACQGVLAQQPDSGPAWALRARAHLELGDEEAGAAALARALELEPKRGDLWLHKARLDRREERLEGALLAFGRALELGESCWLERGTLLVELERYAAATEDLKTAVTLDETNVEAWHELAWARGSLHDWEAADEALRRALAIAPEDGRVWRAKAKFAAARGEHQAALAAFQRAIELGDTRAQTYLERALVRRTLGDQEGVIVDCTQAIAADSRRPDAWNNRAAAHFELGQYEQAVRDYDRAIELVPQEALVRAHRALARLRAGDVDGAQEDCLQALRLEPNHPMASVALAHVRAMQGNLEGALDLATRALAAGGRAGLEALAVRAEVLAGLERYSEAVLDLDRLILTWPAQHAYYLTRGICLARLGASARARSDLQHFLELAPADDPRRQQAQATLDALPP